jgi:hypothetical protein
VPDPAVVLGGKPRVAGQLFAVGEQAAHRGWVVPAVAGGEGVDTGLDDRDGPLAWCHIVGRVEDLPVGGLELGLGLGWDFGQKVTGSVDQTALTQAAGHFAFHRPDQSVPAICDGQQRWAQSAFAELVEEIGPGVDRFRAARGQPDQDRGAGGGDAPGGQHRLGAGAGMHAEIRAVQEQVIQLEVLQTPGGPRGELVFDRLTDPRDRRLRQRGFRAEGISQRGFDIAHAHPRARTRR